MKDDAELLLDYAERESESAFAELLDRHLALVYSAAFRLVNGDVHLAQDVAQSVFADLARKAAPVAKRISARREVLAGWLYTSTRFAAATAIRAEQRRRKYEEKTAGMDDVSEPNQLDWDVLRPVLDEAMARLSVSERDAVLLRFFQGQELKNIGRTMGVSEDAARMRINRSLERLRRLLLARGVSLSTPVLITLISANAVEAVPPALSIAVAAAAAAAATTTGIGLLGFMTMTKIKTAAVSALILAAVGTPVLIQQQTVHRLRRDNAGLLAERNDVPALRADKEQLAREIDRLKNASSRPRSDLLELMRLRSEVGSLRKDSQELARLRSERKASDNSTGDPREGGKTIRAEAWANVGMETPDAALQTFFWAARKNDADLVGNLIRWQKDATVPDFDGLDKLVESLIPGSIRYAGELESMTLIGSTNAPDGTTHIQVELAAMSGKPPTRQEIAFVQEDGLWKPVFNVWSPRQGSIQGTLGARTPSNDTP